MNAGRSQIHGRRGETGRSKGNIWKMRAADAAADALAGLPLVTTHAELFSVVMCVVRCGWQLKCAEGLIGVDMTIPVIRLRQTFVLLLRTVPMQEIITISIMCFFVEILLFRSADGQLDFTRTLLRRSLCRI